MGGEGSGPKTEAQRAMSVQSVLNNSAIEAAHILDNVVNKRKGWTKVPDHLLKVCQYVIDHAIGKARQKVEHSGGIMTYSDLFYSAEALNKKPRDILADAMSIAHKHQKEGGE